MIKEHVPYVTVREDFCEYRAENGQLLKMKVILTDVAVEPTEEGSKSALLGLKNFSTIVMESEIDTSGLEYSTPEGLTDKDVVSELNFKTVKEVVNIYETERALILIAPRVLNIFLTNKKDKISAAPLLRYSSKTFINTLEKETLYVGDSQDTSQQKPQ